MLESERVMPIRLIWREEAESHLQAIFDYISSENPRAARACAAQFQPQHDYVLVGRREALGESFAKLVHDLSTSIVKVHASRAEGPRKPK